MSLDESAPEGRARVGSGAASRALTLALWALAALAVISSGLGAIAHHSPVPYWDMWDGYLGSFVRFSDGQLSELWAQHNEHRIAISRLLFYADIRLLSGTGAFLVGLNLLLCGAIFFLLLLFCRERGMDSRQGGMTSAVAALVCLFSFSWLQEENITWAFQSQFFLAYLLPLAAFYCLYKSTSASGGGVYYVASVGLGALSAVTMANGLLALPLLGLAALLLRVGVLRTAFYFLVATVVTAGYLYGYDSPSRHGSLGEELLENPGYLALYTLTYIGGPAAHLLPFARTLVAALVGTILVGAFIALTVRWFRSADRPALEIALIGFLAYVGATAFVTAGGRSDFGLEQALSSRYATPALVAWSVLLILLIPHLAKLSRVFVLGCGLAIAILFTIPQAKAFADRSFTLSNRMLAALALEFGIADEPQIVTTIYPNAAAALQVSEVPRARNLSIFGISPIADASERLGSHVERPAASCLGHVDSVEPVAGDPAFTRISGWIFDAGSGLVPELVLVADASGSVVGQVITGFPRPDVAAAIDAKAGNAGFAGYVLSDAVVRNDALVMQAPTCALQTALAQ